MNAYRDLMIRSLMQIKEEEIAEIPSDDKIDHVFSERFEMSMENVFESVGKNKQNRYISSAVKKIACAAVCICLAAFTVIMSNPVTRAGFQNAITQLYEKYIKFSFVETPGGNKDFESINDVNITYIPKNFELQDVSEEYEALSYNYVNKDNELKYLRIYVSLNDGLSILTDKAASEYEKIQINNRDAYIIYSAKDDVQYGTIIITGAKICVTVYGYLEKDELIKVAKGIE